MIQKEEINTKVPAVDRTLDIIEFLLLKQQATIKEIAYQCHIPPASTARIIKTLVQRGYIIETKGIASLYSLGLKFLHFSQMSYNSIDLESIAKEEMQKLTNVTNQTCQLAILDGDSVMYTEMILPHTPISILAPLRTPIPLNLSASGKILCAFLPENERISIIQRTKLSKATDNSIIDKLDFLKHISKVPNLGFATDFEEFSQGVGCIAAPIYNHLGKVIASIGITGQIGKYTDEKSFQTLKNQIINSANIISNKIGAKI